HPTTWKLQAAHQGIRCQQPFVRAVFVTPFSVFFSSLSSRHSNKNFADPCNVSGGSTSACFRCVFEEDMTVIAASFQSQIMPCGSFKQRTKASDVNNLSFE